MIKVNEGILISAVRYALGRRTYVVGETVDAVTINIDSLARGTLEVIAKDIANARGYGDSVDHSEWMKLLDRIKSRL